MTVILKRRSILTGFKLTLGYTLVYLSRIVLIPLAAAFAKAATGSWEHFWETITNRRVVAAFSLSFVASLIAASIDLFAGLEFADGGSVAFHGKDTTTTHTRERQVGFVFQHYAL